MFLWIFGWNIVPLVAQLVGSPHSWKRRTTPEHLYALIWFSSFVVVELSTKCAITDRWVIELAASITPVHLDQTAKKHAANGRRLNENNRSRVKRCAQRHERGEWCRPHLIICARDDQYLPSSSSSSRSHTYLWVTSMFLCAMLNVFNDGIAANPHQLAVVNYAKRISTNRIAKSVANVIAYSLLGLYVPRKNS